MSNFLKQLLGVLIVLSVAGCSDSKIASSSAEGRLELTSPDGKNRIHFILEDGMPMYGVSRSGERVIESSAMGFTFKGENTSLGRLELVASDTSAFDETWEQVWGEKQEVRNHYKQLSVELRETEGQKRTLKIE